MAAKLPVQISLDFISSTKGFKKGISEVSKEISILSQMQNVLEENFTLSESKITELNTFVSQKLAQSFVTSSKVAVSSLGSIGQASKDFFTTNYVNQYVNSLNNVHQALRSLIPGFNENGKASEILNGNMWQLQQSMSVDEFKKFGTTLSNFTDDINKFSTAKQAKIIDLINELQNSGKSAPELHKITNEINNLVATTEKVEKLTNAFKNFAQSTVAKIASAVGFTSIFSDTARAQDQIFKTVARMGMTQNAALKQMIAGTQEYQQAFYKTTKDVENAVIDLAKTTSIKFHDAAETFNLLAEARIPVKTIKDLGQVAITTQQVSQAFGISAGEATQFTADLMQIGHVGQAGLKKAADALATLQQNMGLNAAEARDVTAQTGHMLRSIRSLGGKGPKDVGAMTKAVGKLQIAFKSVGAEASDANDLINKMMNPDELENNVLLWSRAGISVQEGMKMMTEGVSEDQMKKLSGAAIGLKKQFGGNAMVMSAMAKEMGLSMTQLDALSRQGETAFNQEQKQAKIEDAAELTRQSMLGQTEKAWNQISLAISSQLIPVLDQLTPFIKKLTDGFMKLMNWVEKNGKFAKILIAGVLADMLSFGKVSGFMFKGIGSIAKKAFSEAGKEGSGFFASMTQKSEGLLGKVKSLFVKAPLTSGKNIAEGAKGVTQDARVWKKSNGFAKAPRTSGPSLSTAASNGAKDLTKLDSAAGKFGQTAVKTAKDIALFGAGIALIGIGIAAVVLSFTLLLKTIDSLNNPLLTAGIAVAALAAIMLGLGLIAKSADKDILMFGSGVALIGVGVALTVGSLIFLMKTIDSLKNPIGTAIIATVALIAIMTALSIVASGGALQILAFGAGVALIGAGIAAVVLSFVALLNAISNFNANIGQAAIAVGSIIAILISVVGALALIGAAITPLEPLMIPLAAIILAVGAGFLMMGLGAKLMSGNLLNAGVSLVKFTGIIAPVLGALLGVSLTLAVVGAAFAVFGVGALAASVGLLVFAGAIALLSIGLTNFSKVSTDSLLKFGLFVAGMTAIAGLLALISVPLGAAALGLGIFSVAMLAMGAAALMVGSSIKMAVDSISNLAKTTSTMKKDMKEGATALNEFFGAIKTDSMKKFVNSFQGASEATKSIGTIVDSLTKLYSAVKGMDSKTFDGLSSSMKVLVEQLNVSMKGIGNSSMSQLKGLGEAFKGVGEGVSATIQGIAKFIDTIKNVQDLDQYVAPLGKLLNSVFSSLQPTFNNLKGTNKDLGDAFKGIGEGIGPALTGIADFIGKVKDLENLDIKKLSGNMNTLMTSAFSAMGTLTDSLRGLDAKSLEGFKSFAEGLQTVLHTITDLQSSLTNVNFASAVNSLKDNLKSLGDSFKDISQKMGPDAKNTGDAFKSFGEGLKSTVDSIVTFSNAYDKISKLDFGILASNISKLSPIITSFNQAITSDGKVAVDMKAVGEAMDQTGKGVTSLAQAMSNLSSMKDLGNSIQIFSDNMSKLLTVVSAINTGAQGFATFTNSLSNFGSSMNTTKEGTAALATNLQSILNVVKDQSLLMGLDKFTTFVKDLAKFGNEAAKAMQNMANAINDINIIKLGALAISGMKPAQIAGNQSSPSSVSVSGPQDQVFKDLNKSLGDMNKNLNDISRNTSDTAKKLEDIKGILSKSMGVAVRAPVAKSEPTKPQSGLLKGLAQIMGQS